MFLDYLKIIIVDLKHRRLRSWLTIIGIIVAVTAIVSLISVGQGMKNAINQQFQDMGTDKITVIPKFMLGKSSLTQTDVDSIKKVNGVYRAAGLLYKLAPAYYNDERKFVYLTGIPTDSQSERLFETMKNFKLTSGRDLKENDKYRAVIGAYVAHGLFKKDVKVGANLLINGQKFKVVGVLKTLGDQQDDSAVYIPLSRARDLLNKPKEIDMIMVQVEPGFSPKDVAVGIEKKLYKLHDVDNKTADFSAMTNDDLMKRVNDMLFIIQVVFLGIAAISLLVGGVGIMTTMYTSVVERTKEIGIMKSIGARNSDILWIFLIEAGIMGLFGGTIGLGFGIGIAKSIEFVAETQFSMVMLKAAITMPIVVGSLLFSFLVGLISGVYPALRAARLRPVEALRFNM